MLVSSPIFIYFPHVFLHIFDETCMLPMGFPHGFSHEFHMLPSFSPWFSHDLHVFPLFFHDFHRLPWGENPHWPLETWPGQTGGGIRRSLQSAGGRSHGG